VTDPVDDLVQRGRSAWPDLAIAEALVRAHLAAKAEAAGEAAADLCAEDLYLAAACAHGVPAALAAFEEKHLAVHVFLARMRPASTLIDDVRQALRVRLLVAEPDRLPRIAEYGGRGSLTAWVRVAAVRLAIDLLRQSDIVADPPSETDSDALLADVQGNDAELSLLRDRYVDELNTALRDAFATLTAEQRNYLRLNYRDGRSIDEIAAVIQVHRATVARRIAAARQQLLDEARALLHERLRLPPGELDSLIGALRGHLHLSVSRLLTA
jgi:RNA polymerase sigma-70 factor (ECF subfamily)